MAVSKIKMIYILITYTQFIKFYDNFLDLNGTCSIGGKVFGGDNGGRALTGDDFAGDGLTRGGALTGDDSTCDELARGGSKVLTKGDSDCGKLTRDDSTLTEGGSNCGELNGGDCELTKDG